MSGVAQLSAPTTGHITWPPTTVIQGTPTVIVEGLPATGIGMPCIPHVSTAFPFPVHPVAIAMGSSSVVGEGIPLARIGDACTCGDAIAMGSGAVFAG